MISLICRNLKQQKKNGKKKINNLVNKKKDLVLNDTRREIQKIIQNSTPV